MLKRLLILLLLAPICLYGQAPARPKLSPSPKVRTIPKPMASVVPEAPPKMLTLKQAESIALRSAPLLGSAYFDAQAAKDVVKEVRSQLFPQIEGDITAVGTSNAIRNEFAGTNHTVPQ